MATIGMTTGKLKAVKPGTVKITAKSKNTGKTVASKTFKVMQRAEAINVSKSNIKLKESEKVTLKVTLEPVTSTDVVRFVSSDKSIATVGSTSGKITAKKAGKCEIKIYAKATKSTSNSAKGNKVAKVKVEVEEKVEPTEEPTVAPTEEPTNTPTTGE